MMSWSGQLIEITLTRNDLSGFETCFHDQEDYVHFRKGNIVIEFEEDNPQSYKKYKREVRERRKIFKQNKWFVVRVSCNSLFWRTALTLDKMVQFVQKPSTELLEL